MNDGPYGDPRTWTEVPTALSADVVDALTGHGWAGVYATEHAIGVPLDGHAPGLPAASERGEHLYAIWGVFWAGPPRAEWSWATAHPEAPRGGTLAPLLARPDAPDEITAQILRVLATGRTLP
ncbi:hypothetical protein ACFY0G_17425 [Streptomyces sp. NPDC001552]|uniref:hypothetical protein n=1 Tax=Streptomyces sp. NPDC001552 TaxID=3364587 RepID=UPI0036962DFE